MSKTIRRKCLNVRYGLPSVIVWAALISLMPSCTSSKNLQYFTNLSDSQFVKLPVIGKPQAVIMPDDMLEIKIAGANEETAKLLNTYSTTVGGTAANGGGNNLTVAPYGVDDNGEIEFPVMGKIKAAGFTRDEFKEKLKEKVSKYLKDPLISIKFVSFRFTVLGEVKSPGSFTVPHERVTVLEALGMAGDMTSYSRRSNVRVLRDSSGIRELGVLDFNDKSVFTSKYYYLQRNDVVYVQPDKSKGQFEDFTRISTIVATIASLVALTVTIIKL